MVKRMNLLPPFSEWSYRGNAVNTAVVSADGWDITWTGTNSGAYIRYEIENVIELLGKEVGFSFELYSVQDGDGRVVVRSYDQTGYDTKLVDEYAVKQKMGREYSFTVPDSCVKLRIEFSHHYSESFASCVFSAKTPCLWLWEEGDKVNLIPYYGDAKFEDYIVNLVSSDRRRVTWTATTGREILNCYFTGAEVAGKAFEFGFRRYKSSPMSKYAQVSIRVYDEAGGYTKIIDQQNAEENYSYVFYVSQACSKMRICFDNSGKHESPFEEGEQTFTLEDYFLHEIKSDGLPMQIHKTQKHNMPVCVDARTGVTHLYFAKDPDTNEVSQYISDQSGALLPVGGGTASLEPEYRNSYTMAHIWERKQEIIDLTRKGNCIVFAVATDIHVRNRDGDAGRYDQVRDLCLLAEHLPVDYICCCGDILSTSDLWADRPFEPRLDKTRKIFDRLRCPWFAVRGNHDYNSVNSSDSVEVTVDNANHMVVTNKDWYRMVECFIPKQAGFQYSFDFGPYNGGYFYVEDYARKHRMIFLNSNETREDAAGKPYVNASGSLECFLYDFRSRHQIEWLVDRALDMSGRIGWTVSFFSHISPYCDGVDGGDTSEFHGYGILNNGMISLIQAFKNGMDLQLVYPVLNQNSQKWEELNINKAFSVQGPVAVVGWFSGHIHDDCYKKVSNVDFCVSTCTSAQQRTSYAKDTDPAKLPPERNDTNYAMSVNVFIVNPAERMVNVVKVGSKRDNAVKTSSDYEFTY